MAYTTGDAIGEVLTPLTGTGRTGADLDGFRLDQAAEDAQAEVDLKLAARYTVPVAEDPDDTPEIVTQVCRDIGAYLATLEARGGRDLEERDPVRLRYARATALLDLVANGTVDIPGIDPIPAETGGLAINTIPDLGLTGDVEWTPHQRGRAEWIRVPPTYGW